MLVLERCYFDDVTLGKLTFEDGESLCIVELPWKGNKQRESCIPEGVYNLRMRVSPIIQRTTKRKYIEGWEVTNVPGRTFIMLHIANTVSDLDGCIGPGLKYGMFGDKLGVQSSVIAFDKLMSKLDPTMEHQLLIKARTVEWP